MSTLGSGLADDPVVEEREIADADPVDQAEANRESNEKNGRKAFREFQKVD